MKTILMLSAAALAGAGLCAPMAMAQTYKVAQELSPRDQLYANDQFIDEHYTPAKTGVGADGRCGGISYGTGQRGCGTATGGPAGGNASRN